MPASPVAKTVRTLSAASKAVADAVGDAASPQALDRLTAAMTTLKQHATGPLLDQAVAAIYLDRHREAAALALQALRIDERCALAWHVLAIAQEKAGDFASSLKCYESAHRLNPAEPEIANDLGRLAYAMGMKDIAEELFAHYMACKPGSVDAANNLACARRDLMRFSDAIETLRPAINANPESALLWNTLGTVCSEQGEMEQAMIFFDEAVRLEPDFDKARYNRGNTRLALGDPQGALADCEAALPHAAVEREASMMRLARAMMLIAGGELGRGWDAYEERLSPSFPDVTYFAVDRPIWTPGTDLAGKHLLLIAEQGLGDEVMFSNVLPDVLEALGLEGRLSLSIEPRLVPLFRRSFPGARIDRHDTHRINHHVVRAAAGIGDAADIDCWAPLGSALRRFRRSVEAYPDRPSYLAADPARVAHWRQVLGELGPEPKVGIVWKSILVTSARARYFSPFETWRPVLTTPGVRFVNLQYGECRADIEAARGTLGVEIWNPPGIDLKDDLDEVAALTCALDLNLGPANAATNIAAACGAPTWMVIPPGAWPLLGTQRSPWYPQARIFVTPGFNQWGAAMAEVAEALSAAF